MSKAIKIRLRKAPKKYDYGKSKFFGNPVIPAEWEEDFHEHIAFLAQIKLEEIACFDKENRLPHTGYLYFFVDTEFYPGDVYIRYYGGEPTLQTEDFNTYDHRFGTFTRAYIMSFEECEEDEACTRLFGVPASGYEPNEGTDKELLLQFDPLDNKTGFLSEVDGYAYIFYNTKREPLSGATALNLDRS